MGFYYCFFHILTKFSYRLKYLKKKYEELGIVIDPIILSTPKSLVPVKKTPAPAGKVKKEAVSSEEEFDSDESFEFEDIKLGSDDEEDDEDDIEEVEPIKPVAKSSKRIAQKPVKETPAPKTKPVSKKAAAPKKQAIESPVASKKKPANKKVQKKVVQESPVAVKKAAEKLLKPKRAGIEKKKKVDSKNVKVETNKLKFAAKKMLSSDSPKKVTKGKDAIKKKAGKK